MDINRANIDLTILCRNMKFLRTLYGISQEDLAADIHLARSTYSTYETGAKIPDLQTLDALSALYNVGFDTLTNLDLSEGLVNRIYFSHRDKEISTLLKDYEGLSVTSKYLIIENMNTLLDRESAFYQEYAAPVIKLKKASSED